jgi:hypothetical protein
MAVIPKNFGSGGSGLTPQDSAGSPSLDTLLRAAAEDIRNLSIAGGATPATRKSSNETFDLSGGKVLTVLVGGAQQDVTFADTDFAAPAAATAAEVVAVLSDEIRGLRHARAAAVAGPAVEIYSEAVGAAATLNVVGGTANAQLGFTTGSVSGTGTNVNLVKG